MNDWAIGNRTIRNIRSSVNGQFRNERKRDKKKMLPKSKIVYIDFDTAFYIKYFKTNRNSTSLKLIVQAITNCNAFIMIPEHA